MRKIFFVDFDDTLIEKQEDPTNFVLPLDLIQLAKNALRSNNILMIVTGRSIDQIDTFFSPVQLNVIGCHGSVVRMNDTQYEIVLPIPAFLLSELKVIANETGCLFENKKYSFTLHVMDNLIRSRVDDAVSFHSSRHQVKSFGNCIEVVPSDTNKGHAIKQILPMLQGSSKEATSFTYIGDDAFTDSSLSLLGEREVRLIPVTKDKQIGLDFSSSPNTVRNFLLNEFRLSEQN